MAQRLAMSSPLVIVPNCGSLLNERSDTVPHIL